MSTHNRCIIESLELPKDCDLELRNLEMRGDEPDVDKEKQRFVNTFYHGNFKKYAATLGGFRVILKLSDMEHYPELPLVEYLCNKVAQLLGIHVARFGILELDGRPAFVTRNFVNKGAENLVHLYRYLSAKDRYDLETIAATIQKVTQRLADVHRFFEICMFDMIIGNNDRHGRNLGFIENGGSSRLSPFYDNVTILGAESGEFFLGTHWNPKSKIAASINDAPSLLEIVTEVQRLGQTSLVKRMQSRISKSEPEILEYINQEDKLSTPMKKALTRLWHERITQFKNI